MLDKLNHHLSNAVCFIFGHVYYQKVFTGKFAHVGSRVPVVVPVMEPKMLRYCPRCGKELKPKVKTKKDDNHPPFVV